MLGFGVTYAYVIFWGVGSCFSLYLTAVGPTLLSLFSQWFENTFEAYSGSIRNWLRQFDHWFLLKVQLVILNSVYTVRIKIIICNTIQIVCVCVCVRVACVCARACERVSDFLNKRCLRFMVFSEMTRLKVAWLWLEIWKQRCNSLYSMTHVVVTH